MLGALTLLLSYQLAGEVVALALGLPVPGPVIGMAMLFATLIARGSAPPALRDTANGLLAHLSLLFVPAGVGVMVLDPGGAAAEDRHQGPVGEHLVGELPELPRGDRRQERCQLPPQPEDVGSREDLELRLIDDARIDPSDPLDDELEIP